MEQSKRLLNGISGRGIPAGKKIFPEEDILRRHSNEPTPNNDDERTDFEKDRSRIVHSAAFRRLQGKTQLFAVGEGDFHRTRLTHSIEVAQIGKGIALRLGADPDLVEAVSLAHDLGHPPFGHAGEEELKFIMKSYGGFEANAQNIRILTQLEKKSSKREKMSREKTNADYGLDLTRATLDGQMKYKVPFDPSRSKFYYREDQEIVEWASKGACPDSMAISFECQIMDWADEVAYSVHDFEDGIHSGFITAKLLHGSKLRDTVISKTEKKLRGTDEHTILTSETGVVAGIWERLMCELKQYYRDFQLNGPHQEYARNELKCHRKELTSHFISKFIKSARLEEQEARAERYRFRMKICPEIRAEQLILNYIVHELVMESAAVLTLEEKGRHIIRELFGVLMEEGKTSKLLPADWKEGLDGATKDCEKARVVCDYLSGMTDIHAQRMYARLFLPHAGSIHDLF